MRSSAAMRARKSVRRFTRAPSGTARRGSPFRVGRSRKKGGFFGFGDQAAADAKVARVPKPASSIVCTIASTRRSFSAWPCGRRFKCAAFAATKSIAEAFWHAATHAPQPMHAAASKAASALGLGTGVALASGALPVRTEM